MKSTLYEPNSFADDETILAQNQEDFEYMVKKVKVKYEKLG